MSTLGERLLRSAKEARAIARGEIEPARVFMPATIDVAAIRKNWSTPDAGYQMVRRGLS